MPSEPERLQGERVMEAMERRARCGDGKHEADNRRFDTADAAIDWLQTDETIEACKYCRCLFLTHS